MTGAWFESLAALHQYRIAKVLASTLDLPQKQRDIAEVTENRALEVEHARIAAELLSNRQSMFLVLYRQLVLVEPSGVNSDARGGVGFEPPVTAIPHDRQRLRGKLDPLCDVSREILMTCHVNQ